MTKDEKRFERNDSDLYGRDGVQDDKTRDRDTDNDGTKNDGTVNEAPTASGLPE